MVENYNRKPNCNCTICGKLVYKRPGQVKRCQGKVFCSTTCYGLSCRKENACVVCGKLILASLNKKTCSRSCSNINRAGIKYEGLSSHDKVKSQRALKTRLLDLRGRHCERCKYNKHEILQIHHKDRNRNNNNMNNLELICPNCHFEEHFPRKSWMKKLFENKKLD